MYASHIQNMIIVRVSDTLSCSWYGSAAADQAKTSGNGSRHEKANCFQKRIVFQYNSSRKVSSRQLNFCNYFETYIAKSAVNRKYKNQNN